MNELKHTTWSDLQTRYEDVEVSEVLRIASFVDPQFKDQHLQNTEEIIRSISEKCMELLEYHSSLPLDHDDDVDNSETIAPPVKKLKSLAEVLKHIEVENIQQSTDTLTPKQQIDQEIASYLDFPAVGLREMFSTAGLRLLNIRKLHVNNYCLKVLPIYVNKLNLFQKEK